MSDQLPALAPTPLPSRRTVCPTMAARGMRSAAELAAGKACGTRVRYYAGCRCALCRAANTAYEAQRAAARRRGEHNGLVDSARAREHLRWLSSQGVGRRTAADAALVAHSIVSKIADGQRLRIRAQTERRLLAVTPAAACDRALIDSTETWRLLDDMALVWGYSGTRIGSEVMGRRVPSCQIKRGVPVTVRTAARVRAAHERLRLAGAADSALAHARLQELYEEGYRRHVLPMISSMAAARGWPAPSLEPHKPHRLHKGPRVAGLLRQQVVVLVGMLHAQLLAEPEAAA